ncbi:T9SS type A sorting domain-containing protein [Tenacibaculum sp. C7A-26P2]|uniref:T9SS type A sorting domain-containing protein n=1 Tax=Tenacibaculum sp. C7A-26P2 TaxID=3447504 RepID=UPI003F832268
MKLKLYFLFFYSSFLFSQNFQEKQLPSPDNMSVFFGGDLIDSTIHYGSRPSNFNGEVILFNHGYIDLNQFFFINNKFYEQTYNEGYQVVFVSTTRGQGMWKNGELLAEAIDIICDKYNVNSLSIIAHSNGGKASEVAMYEYDKNDKVKRVFALGTPYWGTFIADISQQSWFNWLWSVTGLNDGSVTSTTYYCRDVIRPYFDNHPNNNPEKFFIIGGSGFSNGTTGLAPLMFVSGSILYMQEGANDGVAPYKSTLRPGANYLFEEGELGLDHVDIIYGQNVWKYIAPILRANKRETKYVVNKQFKNNNIVVSDYQIVNSENEYEYLELDRNSSEGKLIVFHENKKKLLSLKSSAKEFIPYKYPEPYEKSNFEKHISIYKVASRQKKITLTANSKYVAYLHQANKVRMIYENHPSSNRIEVKFKNQNTNIESTKVTGVITLKTDLKGNPLSEKTTIKEFTFNRGTSNFTLDISKFKEGVYSIFISAVHDDFKRNIASGFTVGELNSIPKDNDFYEDIAEDKIDFKLKTRIINDYLYFKILKRHKENTDNFYNVDVYNINGKRVMHKAKNIDNEIYKISMGGLKAGVYIVQVINRKSLKSFKILKN